jgi:5-methylcytosine-specific restriction protein A
MTNRICAKCKKMHQTKKCWSCNKRSGKRHYNAAWNSLSLRYRKINPLCQDCEKYGRVRACTEVHHIVPLAENPDGLLVWDNLVALCGFCHQYRHGKGGKGDEGGPKFFG